MNRRRYRLSQNRAMRSGLTRRQFIGRAGVATGAIVLTPTLLAACSGDDDDVEANEGAKQSPIALHDPVSKQVPLGR